jgi:hypothetical protein
MKLTDATRMLFQESKATFSFSSGMLAFFILGIIATSLFAGLSFAVRDFERVNPILSFIAGCVTGPLIIFLPYAAILQGAVLAGFAFRLLGFDLRSYEQVRAERTPQGRKPPDAVGAALALVIAGVLWGATICGAHHIPVVSQQIQSLLSHLD